MKEAAVKKDFSPIKSDINVHRAQNELERQLGSFRGVVDTIRRDSGTPSVESIATQLSGMPTGGRAPALLALQCTHGNRYVQRVVVGIQAKLKVGQPGDMYEQEEKILHTKKVFGQSSELNCDFESRIQTLMGGGQPLPESARDFFEPRFGYDFSGVRVHTDGKAAQSARALNAMAFTAGREIVFCAGRYVPDTTEGKRLLAHELAHVVQQSSEVPKGYRLSYLDFVSLPRGLPIQIQRFCTLPPPTSVPSGTRLNPTELQQRRNAIHQAIIRSRSTYPLSAANLQHWLDGSGNDRLIPQGEYDFTNLDSGVPHHLLQSHRRQIAEGIERRLNTTHPQSLQSLGTQRLLSWQDSMRALPIRRGTLLPSPPMERDLSTALGGFTVSSRVRLRSLQLRGNIQEVEVLSWQAHICDRYDWIVGVAAPILIPSSVALPPIPQGAGTVSSAFGMQLVVLNDVWMAEVEQSGGARAYDIYSDIFNVPANVRQNFVAVNGNVSP